MSSIIAFGQTTSITVGSYNVDGLPNELIGIPINADGPGTEKSPLIGTKLQEEGWDIIGLNEDFNYHSEIISTMSGYNFSTHQGKFEASMEAIYGVLAGTWRFPIDGLMLITKNNLSVSGEDMVTWRDDAVFGYLTNYQDSLTKKGFRYYHVGIDSNTTIDVIILHADAGYDHFDRNARVNSMDQMCNYIESLTSKNPIIIMGDFNNLYFRDNMKELFIDRLNEINGITAKDAWVESNNKGEFPEYMHPADNDDDEKWNDDNMKFHSKSETLDKIVYINRADSPVQLTLTSMNAIESFTDAEGKQLSDHLPVEAKFDIVGTSTSIRELNETASCNTPAVNLHGMRVGKNYNGIVIINGKKYVK